MSQRLTEAEKSFIIELKKFRDSIEKLHEVIEELIESFEKEVDEKRVREESREPVKES